jgi:arginyl-tRNA synthetase
MIQAKQELLHALQAALNEVVTAAATATATATATADTTTAAPAPAVLVAAFESPKQAAHGDFAITAAMSLARALKKNPRELAQQLVQALQAQPAVQAWVQALEIAGPGFINLRLSAAAKQAVVPEVLAAGEAFGLHIAAASTAKKRVLVEFVSANPTGPLHTGHTRQAALGDAICSLLQTQGVEVTREFYYNDAGVQIATLATSVQARLMGLKPGDAAWPEAAYNGDYIADVAADFAARKTVHADDRKFTASGDINDIDSIRQFAVAYLRHEQDLDLRALGVHFDHYFLESSLYTSGRVDSTVGRLVASGKTYEHDGALWLRTTDYGDDKDRVMRKQDGSYTYFVPDVAYHVGKFERGFTQAINIQGGDHHGTIARVRAGVQAVGAGVTPGYPDYVLHKMVTVMKDGAEVKISKRAGSYVTLRDLVDWTGRDAVRFFMLSRKADTEFVFDVDLARKANDENPVFYVQYAHARICSVLAKAGPGAALAASMAEPLTAHLSLLTAPTETALMLKLAEYPDMLTRAAADLAPHDVTFYLRDLAAAFHSYYANEKFLVDEVDLAQARCALLRATAQVLRNALAVLGVSAPQAMAREAQLGDASAEQGALA